MTDFRLPKLTLHWAILNLQLFRIFICAVDLLYMPAVVLVVKIRQMAPLHEIKLLLNLVQIAIFSIHWP